MISTPETGRSICASPRPYCQLLRRGWHGSCRMAKSYDAEFRSFAGAEGTMTA